MVLYHITIYNIPVPVLLSPCPTLPVIYWHTGTGIGMRITSFGDQPGGQDIRAEQSEMGYGVTPNAQVQGSPAQALDACMVYAYMITGTYIGMKEKGY